MSVNVPSGVKDATHPGTSLSSAVWYALRMICSLFMSDSPRPFGLPSLAVRALGQWERACSCDAHSAVDAEHLAGHPRDARVGDRDDPPSDLAGARHATKRYLTYQPLFELRDGIGWYA